MTAETSAIRDGSRQCRVGVLRVVVDVARQAATTAIAHGVKCMFGLVLPEVAACAQFAQHRVSDAVTQRLEVHRAIRTSVPFEESAGNVNDAFARMHQVIRDGSNPVGMTRAAGALRIRQIARKSDQAIMRIVLLYGPVIAGVASDAVLRRKGVGGVKPGLLLGMALQAGAICRRTHLLTEDRIREQTEHAAQTVNKEYSKPHGIAIARLHARDP